MNKCVRAFSLMCLMPLAGIASFTAYADSIPLSNCPDRTAIEGMSEADRIKNAEALLNQAQEVLNRGDLACGEKIIQRVNRLAASSRDADAQARLFYLVKDMLLAWFANGPNPVDQKVKLTTLGKQHKTISEPGADDVFSDVVFLVKSAEIINGKGASCEGARLYLEAAKLEEWLPSDHSRYIEWQGLQKEFERDVKGWCFGEIAGISKVVTNSHPDIGVNKIMGRIVYYGLPVQLHLVRKTEPTLVPNRMASVNELKTYLENAEPFFAECLFCGKDARPVLIGRLEEVSGFLEMARGDNDKAMRYFDKAANRYGTIAEATSRSWHRLVFASQLMWAGIEPDYSARLMVGARNDILAIDDATQRSDRTRMYNDFSNRLRGQFTRVGKPIPEGLVPITTSQ